VRELALHILDIMENSLIADADLIKVFIKEDIKADRLIIKIADNGSGMEEKQAKEVLNPFVTQRTEREVGLGLSLFQAAAKRCEGDFNLASVLGEGTKVEAIFKYSHLDRAPLGDLAATLAGFIATNGDEIDLNYEHIYNDAKFIFNTKEVKKELTGLSITNLKIINWIKSYLEEGLREIRGGEV